MVPNQGSGTTCFESFAWLDLRSSSWKTSRPFEAAVSTSFSETWPRAGMMLCGIAYRRDSSAPITREIGCFLWAPCQCGNHWCRLHDQHAHDCICPPVEDWGISPYVVRYPLPTPTVNDSKNQGGDSQGRRNTPPLNAIFGGRLNPIWIEWFMGFPTNWTDLEPSETQLCLPLQKSSDA